jgi:hypothetical protein|tara:strand:+ start:542 stop:928 length:387 start_codon:yes stop_codon:yes gene_type:complete
MAILGNILGNLLGKADTIVDEVITSKEEKLQLKNQLQKIVQEQESLIEKQVSKRWVSDMSSDNWLSKNIRPMSLIFLTVVFTIISFADGNIGKFTLDEGYKPIYQSLLLLAYGAYFGSRGLEKIKKNK